MATAQISLPYKFTPRWYQIQLFKAMDNGCKKALLVWSRRAGKDQACWNYMIKCAFTKVGVYYYFFPTYAQGRKALWENVSNGRSLIDFIPGESEDVPNDFIKRISKQEMTIELQNGSIIRVVAADQVEKSIVGTNPIGMVFSEFSLQDPAGWKLMAPVLLENKGWAIFNGTPRGRNHMYDLYIKNYNNPNWFVSYLSVDKLGLYTDEELKKQVKEYYEGGASDEDVAQELFCSWSSGVRGSYYTDLVEDCFRTNRIGEYPADLQVYTDTFWDLGFSDDTVIWFRQTVGRKIVFVDYYAASGKPISHFIDILKQKGYNYRTHYLPHDADHNNLQTGKSIRSLVEEGLDGAGLTTDVAVAGKLPLQHGITLVRKRFGLYHFNAGPCAEGIKALEAYHRRYDSARQTYTQHPVHDWSSHAADALRTEAVSSEGFDEWDGKEPGITIETDFNLFE